MKSQHRGLTRIIKAFGYSVAGFKAAWQNEAAFRQETVLFIILTPFAFWLGHNAIERALLLSCLFLVLIAELLNSAIEALADGLSEEWHPMVKRAKDLGSAAVLVSLCLTSVIWGLMLWQ
jgi:diacylglycerol kinase (ATP)